MNLSLNKSNPALLLLLAMFSCSLLLNFGSFHWRHPWVCAVIIAAVGLQLINYKFWWATVISIIAGLTVMLPLFPRLANHANVEFGGSILILILIARNLFSGKGLRPETITQILRWTLILTYFWAGFHKLNSGFFMTEGSCGTHVMQNMPFVSRSFFNLNGIGLRVVQVGTIVIEMVLPFGLLFYKTRRFTVLILVLFHSYLSLCNFSNFSAFAGFLLLGSIIDLKSITVDRKLINGVRFYQIFSAASVLASYVISRFGLLHENFIMAVNGVIFNIGWFGLFYIVLSTRQSKSHSVNFSPLCLAICSIISLWAVQGYVGLSNTATLTMFSNLVTEKSRSNHYLINTKYTKIWGFEEDYVTIVSLPKSTKWAEKYSNEDYDIPMIHFKYLCNKWVGENDGKLSCTFIHHGKSIVVTDLEKSDYSKTEWWYRYLMYRRIPKDGVYSCMW